MIKNIIKIAPKSPEGNFGDCNLGEFTALLLIGFVECVSLRGALVTAVLPLNPLKGTLATAIFGGCAAAKWGCYSVNPERGFW
jgi:hypothetical protein